tara:strand:+ start:1529 stop:2320 length:792 start_codon:yes stop_codon:yes gene_type:complete
VKPLSDFPESVRREIRGVFLDIDDTLTSDGRLTAAAYTSLERLQRADKLVVPVTGRPAGWCDHMARMWPVGGIIGENGGFYFRYDYNARQMIRRYHKDDQTLARNRGKLELVGNEIVAAVSGAAIAADQRYRETDLAVDFREDVKELNRSSVENIVGMMKKAGMTTKVSSIHVNGWFGNHDKLTMIRCFLTEEFGIDIELEKERFIFVGDSPNDQPAFEYFPNAVGVANVVDFSDELVFAPAYVTEARAGEGFSELIRFLLED